MLGHAFSSAPSKCNYYITIMKEGSTYLLVIPMVTLTTMYPHRAQQTAQLISISEGGQTSLSPPINDELPLFGYVYNFTVA